MRLALVIAGLLLLAACGGSGPMGLKTLADRGINCPVADAAHGYNSATVYCTAAK